MYINIYNYNINNCVRNNIIMTHDNDKNNFHRKPENININDTVDVRP